MQKRSYCFLNYVPAKDGHGTVPDCPDGVTPISLAHLYPVGWGIFEVRHDESWSPVAPLSDELARLIVSGKRYPPALGLARQEVMQVFADSRPEQFEFASAYRAALRTHLSRQQGAPYVLAPAMNDAPNLTTGEWYWVLEISGSPPGAHWVSDDYCIYANDMNDFDLTGQQLKQLGYRG